MTYVITLIVFITINPLLRLCRMFFNHNHSNYWGRRGDHLVWFSQIHVYSPHTHPHPPKKKRSQLGWFWSVLITSPPDFNVWLQSCISCKSVSIVCIHDHKPNCKTKMSPWFKQYLVRWAKYMHNMIAILASLNVLSIHNSALFWKQVVGCSMEGCMHKNYRSSIYLHLFRDYFRKISLHSSEQNVLSNIYLLFFFSVGVCVGS